jgi:hypothetical protein
MNDQRNSGIAVLVAFGLLTSGCDEQKEHGERVSKEREELREKAALHPTDRTDRHAETAEELKKDLDLDGDGKKPKSAAEMRETMNLHPDPPGQEE